MKLTPESMDALFGPVLTGSYEHELHDAFERAIAHPYTRILNIGCAFGYYSVGLALRMPQVEVFAFDTADKEQKRCRDMAVLNNTADRVHIGGEFKGEDFAAYADKKTLALVDIEGEELVLLDPARYPALAKIDMIVELHDTYNERVHIKNNYRSAFMTHDVEIIYNKPKLFDFTTVTVPVIMPIPSTAWLWPGKTAPDRPRGQS